MARRDDGDIALNMTPMIDVVFNLIIFFMLVTDLTQKELEELKLPECLAGVPNPPDDQCLILNIVKGPDHAASGAVRILVRGVEVDLDGLTDLLFAAAERRREGDGPAPPSALSVLIRADRDVRWRAVQHVLQACAHGAVRIYKIEFATAMHEGDGR